MGCAPFADLGFPVLSKLVCSENIRFWVVPILQIEGFPTILFFPAGEKNKKPVSSSVISHICFFQTQGETVHVSSRTSTG